MGSRTRKAHYLPKFYLAGFTQSGDADGDLYVLDQEQTKEWRSSPEQAANRRDFYVVDLGPNEDPGVMEQILGRLEGEFSSVIREIIENKQLPSGERFDWFLNFVALMAVRIPRTRNLASHVVDRTSKEQLRKEFASPDGWKKFKRVLEARGQQVKDDEYADYRKFVFSENYSVDLDQTSHVQMMVEMIGPLLPALAARRWSLGIGAKDSPDLICSDFPVSIWPTKGADSSKRLTLYSPNTLLTFPITRRLIAIATFEPQVVATNRYGIALLNTITATDAKQLFASGPDFIYLAQDKSIRGKSDLLQILRKDRNAHNSLEKSILAWFADREAIAH